MPEIRDYRPPGPVLKRFHESTAFYRACAGPIGSGKTTGAGIGEPMFGGLLQEPNSEGVRTFKSGVLRDTYRNLYATTMKTWLEWMPREIGHFTGSDDRPAVHRFPVQGEAGGQQFSLDIEVEFRALGPNSVEAVCRGWELNGAYLDEADLMPQEALSFLGGRVMRAGDVKLRRTRGVWCTFNKPDVDHWLYQLCMEGGLEGLEFFDQPGGLLPGVPYRTNSKAENLANLDADYYTRAATGQPDWYVRRMIRNEWGASISGEVIYPEFRRELHVLPIDMDPPPGSTLKIGLDGGGTPAAVIMGRDGRGRRVVYDEVVIFDPYDPKGRKLQTGVGARRFAQAIRDTMNLPRYRGCHFEIGYGDPAAFYGADREMGEYSFMETVGLELKMAIVPADSNEVGIRHDAVHMLLGELADDGLPLLQINPRCRMLLRGFSGDYKWEIIDPKQPGKRLRAQKSATSHVHDALQYDCLGDIGRAGVTAGKRFDKANARIPGRVDVPTASPLSLPNRFRGEAPGTHYKMDFKLW